MSVRDNRSARVVIMDDISWSEPAPRGRRASSGLDAPEWMQQPEARVPPARRAPVRYEEPAQGYRVDEYLDDDLGETVGRWQAELSEEPALIEYAGELDEEAVWGPRPRLMAEEPGGRRTIVITGRVADRHIAPRASARGGTPVHARGGFAADRTAMWAVLLCVILLLVALTSH
jgi:hypothetical protein